MTVKFYAAQDDRFELNEERQFDRIRRNLQQHLGNSDDEYWVIVSYIIGGTDFDMIVLRRDAIISLEMKNYSGEVIGAENGQWAVEKDNGDRVNIKGTPRTPNPFQQAGRQRRSLRNHFNKILPGLFPRFHDNNPIEYVYSVVCFANGSRFDCTQLPDNALWFRLTQEDELVKTLRKIDNKDEYAFRPSEIETILKEFGVEHIKDWAGRTAHSRLSNSDSHQAPNGQSLTKNYSTAERFITARDRYRPDSIKFLIVAESPPSFGGYFYFDFATRHDYLFKETMKALEIIPEDAEVGEGTNKEQSLRQFQSRGFYLVDVVYTPIGELSDSEKRKTINEGIPGLIDEVMELDPEWIIIVKASIFEKIRNSMIASGLGAKILNTDRIPFPSHGRHPEYRRMFRDLVVYAESGPDKRPNERAIRRLTSSCEIDDDDLITKEFLDQRKSFDK